MPVCELPRPVRARTATSPERTASMRRAALVESLNAAAAVK